MKQPNDPCYYNYCVVLDRLTTSNQVLLVLGVMVLCGGIVVLIILTVLKVTEKGVISKYN